MVVKIGDYEIHSYDANDNDQRHLKYVLDNDLDFRNYVTKNIKERLTEGETTQGGGLQYNHSYLVKYKNDFVGYIRLEELIWNGTLNIQMAVSPEFRNQKLGSNILKVLSDYLLENYEEIIKLRGIIEKRNKHSKLMAERAGFIEEKKEDDYIYVSKTR